MAVGVSVKLPLQKDSNDGAFQLNKTIVDAVKQNFKMLLLTEEGEKVMDVNFGVGLRRELFENFSLSTSQTIRERIVSKTKTYLPFVRITNIFFGDSLELNPEDIDKNQLSISIEYEIEPLKFLDKVQIKVF
jgi:phage baseplate assembly protein W